MHWRDIAVHDEHGIRGFFGEYRYLSNFHLTPIQYEGVVYPSVENAYMAAKCQVHTQRIIFKQCAPSVAKVEGMKVKLRDDWESVKLNIMFELNKQKFANDPALRVALKSTNPKYLEETNYWNDTFWGVCKNVGQNQLGKILMKVRDGIIEDLW